jgi:hypothetical protein
MAVRLAYRRDLPLRTGYWKQLGWTALYVTLGSILGIVIMAVPLLALTALAR